MVYVHDNCGVVVIIHRVTVTHVTWTDVAYLGRRTENVSLEVVM